MTEVVEVDPMRERELERLAGASWLNFSSSSSVSTPTETVIINAFSTASTCCRISEGMKLVRPWDILTQVDD